MAGTFAADSKLMYYPTDMREVYRIGALLFDMDYDNKKLKELDPVTYSDAVIHSTENGHDLKMGIFNYLVENNKLDLIRQCFKFKQNDNSVVDTFAGMGEWLGFFEGWRIAVELDRERFKSINAQYKYNLLFEEVELPKRFANILLFNPPYGSTNGVRNVRHYLQMTIERNILDANGLIIMVIRGDDAMECFDLFFDNFQLLEYYKVNDDEYEKFKQFVIIGRKRAFRSSVWDYQRAKTDFDRNILNGKPFDMKMYNNYNITTYTKPDVSSLFAKLEQKKKRANIHSSKDKVWKWVMAQDADLGSDFQLLMPRAPKPSELANILASGIINGEVEDEQFPHIVSGGVKRIKRLEMLEDENGEAKYIETNFSKPYLNVLYMYNGEVKVKQIEGAIE